MKQHQKKLQKQKSNKLYREFFRRKYNEYRHKYTKVRDTGLMRKIIRQWQYMSSDDKNALYSKYYEVRSGQNQSKKLKKFKKKNRSVSTPSTMTKSQEAEMAQKIRYERNIFHELNYEKLTVNFPTLTNSEIQTFINILWQQKLVKEENVIAIRSQKQRIVLESEMECTYSFVKESNNLTFTVNDEPTKKSRKNFISTPTPEKFYKRANVDAA